MASQNKNNSTGRSGLRVLWIPGRKKHSHKGRMEVVSKPVRPVYQQKKIEPWTIGGAKGQNEIIRSDAASGLDIPVTAIVPVTCAISKASTSSTANVEETTEMETNQVLANGNALNDKLSADNPDKIDDCYTDGNNTATMIFDRHKLHETPSSLDDFYNKESWNHQLEIMKEKEKPDKTVEDDNKLKKSNFDSNEQKEL